MNAPTSRADARKGLLAKVHVAKKQMGLDDAAYREVLMRVTGQDSSKDCSIGALEELLREFARLGWTARKTHASPSASRGRPLADSEVALKLRALWLSAWNLGVVDDPSETALAAFCKRVSGGRKRGVDALQWLTEADARKCIEGLKSWIAREATVDWSEPDPRLAVILAQSNLLASLDPDPGRMFQRGQLTAPYLVGREPHAGDVLIREFGQAIRALKRKAAQP